MSQSLEQLYNEHVRPISQEQRNVVNEGLLDRIKGHKEWLTSNVAGLKQRGQAAVAGAKSFAKNDMPGVQKASQQFKQVGTTATFRKNKAVIDSHNAKLQKSIEDYVADMVKIGALDDAAGNQLKTNLLSTVKKAAPRAWANQKGQGVKF